MAFLQLEIALFQDETLGSDDPRGWRIGDDQLHGCWDAVHVLKWMCQKLDFSRGVQRWGKSFDLAEIVL